MSFFYVKDPATVDGLLAAATVLNTSSVTMTRSSSAYNPVTDAIALVNERRQRNITIGSSTFGMDLSEVARANLLAIGTSGRFDKWTAANGLTVVADTTAAPSGEVIAQTLTDPGGSLSSAQQTFTVANDGLSYVFSIYVLKTAGGTAPTFGVTLALTGGTGVTTNARINTDTGAQQYGSNANTTVETSSAGTWYRVIVKVTNNTSGNTTLTLDVYPAAAAHGASTDDASVTGSAICTFADLNKSGFATSFGSNRNLLMNSESIATTWAAARSSISSNTTADPLTGNVAADTLVEDATASNTHLIRQTVVKAATSTQFTFSVYLKQSARTWASIRCTDVTAGTNGVGRYFDLAGGVLGSTDNSGSGWTLDNSHITAVASGFYRCDITVTTDSAASIVCFIHAANADNGKSYTGTSSNSIIVFGTQLVYGAIPQNYWATNGAAVGNRSRDALLSTTSLSTTEGTLMWIVRPYGWSGTVLEQANTVTLTADTNIIFNFNATGGNYIRVDAGGNETATISSTLGFTNGVNTTVFGTIDATSVRAYVSNGALATPDTTVTAPWSAISTVPIGYSALGNDRNPDAYVLLLYWPTALPISSQQLLIDNIPA